MELRTDPESVISHWHQLIEGLNASPVAFYDSVQASLATRCVPDTTISRVEYQESGLMSAKRLYLHVTRGRQVFDVCAAPFGKAFFISSWLADTRVALPIIAKLAFLLVLPIVFFFCLYYFGLLLGPFAFLGLGVLCLWLVQTNREVSPGGEDIVLALPLVGRIYEWLFKANTYYAMDTALMFRDAVHNAVLEAVDGLTTAQGIRALTDAQRVPINRALFGGPKR